MPATSAKGTTKYPGTKLLFACGSLLAFAGLTGFIASQTPVAEPAPVASIAPEVAQRVIISSGNDQPEPTPTPVEAPRPVARTRGT